MNLQIKGGDRGKEANQESRFSASSRRNDSRGGHEPDGACKQDTAVLQPTQDTAYHGGFHILGDPLNIVVNIFLQDSRKKTKVRPIHLGGTNGVLPLVVKPENNGSLKGLPVNALS